MTLTMRADVLEAMKRIVVDEIEDDGSGKFSTTGSYTAGQLTMGH